MIWILTISISLVLLVLTAAGRGTDLQLAYVHMLVAALVAVAFALIAIRELKQLEANNASRATRSATAARFMGFVWSWGALGLLATYGTGILMWSEWWHFLIAFVVAAGLCLFFAATLDKDEASGHSDETFLSLSRYLAIAQLVGMIVVMVGLLVDGKMTRFLEARHGDWAANNLFFFGALALAAISWTALQTTRSKRTAA